jgi:copper homeostasis protein (lipoprotein)
MDKKTFWIILIVAVIIIVPLSLYYFSSHSSILNKNLNSTPSPSQSSIDNSLTKAYSGILPCADCEGIQTTLFLTQKDANSSEGTFSKSEMYIGTSTKPSVTKGNWTAERGDSVNPDAIVIVLNPSDPDKVERYLQVDAKHLEKLDKNGNRNPGGVNYTLTLQ